MPKGKTAPKEGSSLTLERAPIQTHTNRLAYSKAETASILGVSKISIERLEKRGLIKSSKAFRHKLYPVSEIERFLKSTL